MTTQTLPSQTAISSFLGVLREQLPDARDNRGKRHNLTFVVVAVAVALTCMCKTLSSVQRFIENRLDWLRSSTGMPVAKAVSRAQLPRILDGVDLAALNKLIAHHFNACGEGVWFAGDGKALRGSSRNGKREAVVLMVRQDTGAEVARTPQSGAKTSEIPVMRELLAASGLDKQHITLDAGHCNPQTLGQIADAGGTFLTQVKENQPHMLEKARLLSMQESALGTSTAVEKAHGRLTVRTAKLYTVRPGTFPRRWGRSKIRRLAVVRRQTQDTSTGMRSDEVSYYITNHVSTQTHAAQLEELASAVRGHWRVESNNWVRDTALGEDLVRIKAPNQAQVMASLRSVVLAVVRTVSEGNLQAVLDRVCHVPSALKAMFRKAKFL